jgi:hypothetical protein
MSGAAEEDRGGEPADAAADDETRRPSCWPRLLLRLDR